MCIGVRRGYVLDVEWNDSHNIPYMRCEGASYIDMSYMLPLSYNRCAHHIALSLTYSEHLGVRYAFWMWNTTIHIMYLSMHKQRAHYFDMSYMLPLSPIIDAHAMSLFHKPILYTRRSERNVYSCQTGMHFGCGIQRYIKHTLAHTNNLYLILISRIGFLSPKVDASTVSLFIHKPILYT